MTFFYNLNNKLNAIRDLPSVTHGQLNERDMSRAAKGYEKYGKEGMEALAKAGRDGKALDPIRAKYDKYDNTEVDEGLGSALAKGFDKVGDMSDTAGAKLKGLKANITKNPKDRQAAVDAHRGIMKKEVNKHRDEYGQDPMYPERGGRYANAQQSAAMHKIGLDNNMEEGLGDMARKVGGMVKKVAGKAMDTVGHGSDADMIRDLQKKMGMPQTGMKPGDEPNPKQIKEKMSPAKAKSFAALAEPKDKITFADKIAGAKKEVDEMLGDVAAEAMKQALGGGKGRNAEMDEASTDNAFTAHKRPKIEKPAVGTVTRGSKHDVEEIPGGRRVTRRVDPSGISVGADDDAPASGEKRGRGRPKGPAKAPERVTGGATKHKGGRKTNEGSDYGQAQQIYDDLADVRAVAKQAQRGGEFPQGFASRLESVLYAAMTLIKNQQAGGAQVREEELDEKAVSKKQQRFMGMVHAAQKGEKPASKEVAKVAKGMGKKDAEDFAATKHKGLPEKKKSDSKKEKTEETADSTPSKGGIKFGGGIYDSMNRELENMIAESMARLDESMSINMSMNNDEHGGPSKSLTVTATDEDAMKLSQLLKSAGLGGGDSEGYGGGGYKSACGCGTPDCSCGDEKMDEVDMNKPDYPTETETSGDALQYAGGLNKPKATGQTTTPVIASQDDRQHSYAEAEEDALHRMMEMAGVKKKEVDEEKTEEGNKFTGNLAKARADGKKEADLDGDGDMEKVQESIFDLTNQWRAYKG